MNIQDATKKAMEINGYLVNTDVLGEMVAIKPTKLTDGYVLLFPGRAPFRRWQPGVNDILSQKWETVESLNFNSEPDKTWAERELEINRCKSKIWFYRWFPRIIIGLNIIVALIIIGIVLQ